MHIYFSLGRYLLGDILVAYSPLSIYVIMLGDEAQQQVQELQDTFPPLTYFERVDLQLCRHQLPE